MKNHASEILKRFLVTARDAEAHELRLVSDRLPMMVVGKAIRCVDETPLNAATVRDIHLACLALASGESPTADATFAYRIFSETAGPVRCAYTIRERARSLSLILEGEASKVVEIETNGKPPTLKAQAKVEQEPGNG